MARQNFLGKSGWLLYRDTPQNKNIVKIALSSTVFKIKAFLCFGSFAKKFENSKWPLFLVRENFWKNVLVNLQRSPIGKKFRQNRSISHGFQDISIFEFCDFCEKFKMAAIFGETKIFLKIGMATLQRYTSGKKFR